MKNKKGTKIPAIIILLLAVVLIITALVIAFSGDKKNKQEVNQYKQCAEKEEDTNYEHTGINYYIDKNNNRINNSEALVKQHDSKGENEKKGKLSITDMEIISKNCDENRAEMSAVLTNNSEENFGEFMLIFDIKDKDGNDTHKFAVTVTKLDVGETTTIYFKTLGRIIDAYDYEFTYTYPTENVG